MTEGEKMVWAAAYVSKHNYEYELEKKYMPEYRADIPSAIEGAYVAVIEMREARQEVLAGYGENEQLEMLDEMLDSEDDDNR